MSIIRKILPALILCLFLVSPAFSAPTNWYVRDCDGDSSCGTAAGTSWTNPFDQLTSAETAAARGDTIYVADGTYTGATLNTAVLNELYIYIKKATASDYGGGAGWDNAYGNGQAVFTSRLSIYTAYWDIDGITGSGNSGHGFKIINSAIYGGISSYLPQSTKHHIRLKHIEFAGSGGTYKDLGIYLSISTAVASYADPNLLIESCYFYDHGGGHLAGYGGNYIVIRNSYFTDCCQYNDPNHKEMIKENVGSDYWWIHNNVFKDWRGYSVTGGIILAGGNSHWYIYSNLFYYTAQTLSGGNRVIGGLDSSAENHDNVKVFNNTFYNINQTGGANVLSTFGIWTDGSNEVYNNLWVSCTGLSGVGNKTGITANHNAFYSTPNYTTRVEGDVSLDADPLTNSAGYDFTVGTDGLINSGTDLSAYDLFTTDFVGNPWSTWGMGAYVYAGEPAPDVTAPTISSATINTDGDLLTIVLSEALELNNNSGFTLTMSKGAAGLSYFGSSGNNTLIYAITTRNIDSEETGTLDYVTVANGIEDLAGNDLASTGESDINVTNSSTYPPPTETVYTITPTFGGGCTIAPYVAFTVVSGGTAQFTCTPDDNYQCVAWTGTCGGSGTTTLTTSAITADCTVIQPCLKKASDHSVGSGPAITVGSGPAISVY